MGRSMKQSSYLREISYDQKTKQMFDRREQGAAARGLCHLAGRDLGQFGMSHDGPLHRYVLF